MTDLAMKLVPAEPTEEMLTAWANVLHRDWTDRRVLGADFVAIYQAILAAAPSPWQPIGDDQRDGSKIIAIGRDDYGNGAWRRGTPYWDLDMGLKGRWMSGPFISSCQPTHFFPWPVLPPLPTHTAHK